MSHRRNRDKGITGSRELFGIVILEIIQVL